MNKTAWLSSGALAWACDETSAAEVLSPETLDRAATAVHVATLAHFDLVRPSALRVPAIRSDWVWMKGADSQHDHDHANAMARKATPGLPHRWPATPG